MALSTEATLVNSKNSKQFLFRCLMPVKFKKNQPVIAIPFISTSPDNTVFFRFIGQTESVPFTFLLMDDGVDVSNGTEAGGVTSVKDQVTYLKDTVFSAEYDASWTLSIDGVYSAVTVVIEDLEIEPRPGWTFAVGNISLKRGRIGSLS